MSVMTDLLPEEIFVQIFSYLPPKDLKSAALVCRSWEAMVVGVPRLWTWAVITINTVNDVKMKLKVSRFKQIKTMRFRRQPEHLEEVFEALLAYPSIKKIYGMKCWDLSSVEASVVAGVLGRLDVLALGGFYGCCLSKYQIEYFFTVIAERDEPMKKLEGEAWRLEVLSPAVFAAAVTNVKELRLLGWGDDEDQVGAMLRHIVENDSPLAKLYTCASIGNIAPDLLGSALNRMQEVYMGSLISLDQATAVLKGVLEGESKLKKLWLIQVRARQSLDRDLVKLAEKKIGRRIFKLPNDDDITTLYSSSE